MNTNGDPKELAKIMCTRSRCHVQVGAVISDTWGVFGWGWNHSGPDGFGLCAERHAIRRANKNRLDGATVTVYSRRGKNGKALTSWPCRKCWENIMNFKLGKVVYFHDGEWREW